MYKRLDFDNLLGRDKIEVDVQSIGQFLNGKNILITGAGGSIGSSLVRELIRFSPRRIVGYEVDETELYELFFVLSESGVKSFLPIVGDIKNERKVEEVIKRYEIDIIYHSAAYKQVPFMERFPEEAIYTNVVGTYRLFEVALRCGVSRIINISSDKAVKPKSIMGLTKRVSEIMCKVFNHYLGEKRFVSIRFGNVIGSRGSVVPLFQRMIEEKRKVLITDKKANRFFISVENAVMLIFYVSTLEEIKYDVYMLDMGKAINIEELAYWIIRQYGLEPLRDVKIEYIGLRDGEKLSEELLYDNEDKFPTENPKVFGIVSFDEYIYSLEELRDKIRAIEEVLSFSSLDYKEAWLLLSDFSNM
jgi:FlaA1/EpsC-like NDP-sugar epimerase